MPSSRLAGPFPSGINDTFDLSKLIPTIFINIKVIGRKNEWKIC
jgi:hypothetical protein